MLVAPFLEEVLRLKGPFNGFWRRATSDTEVGGAAVRAGDALHLAFAVANRDPQRFASPDDLTIDSRQSPHLAFGHGAHFCVGAPLARAEARLAIEALLTNRAFEIAPGASPTSWFPDGGIHGPLSLHLKVSHV